MFRKAIFITVCCVSSFSLAHAQSEPPRFSFDIGGGFTKPLGHLENRIDTGWNVQAGAGLNFSPRFGVMGQFMYTQSNLQSGFLQSINVPDGNFRMWGFSVDPVIHLSPRGKVDFYLIGGPGIYRRTVDFTQPTTATINAFDPFFGYFFPVTVPSNQVIGSYGTTRFGLNGGGGLSFRVGSGHTKVFAEARLVRMYTKGTSTSILPVTFGLRW